MGVFGNLKPINHAPRNGFDLSRYSSFSSKVGMIKPVFHQLTLPSSDYEINLQQICRTQPLNTAAFAGFSLNYDVVWCPLNHLYSGFNAFIAQRNQKNLVYQPSNLEIPTFSLKKFLEYLLPYAVYDYWINSYTYVGVNVSLPLRSYFTRQSDTSVALSCIDALDMLGYGNFLPLVKSLAKYVHDAILVELHEPVSYVELYNYLSDYEDNTKPFFTNWNVFYVDAINGDLGSRDAFDLDSYLNFDYSLQPTLWPALVYNKMFYEYYRNTYYDDKFQLNLYTSFNTFEEQALSDYVYLYNFDDFSTGVFNENMTVVGFLRLLQIFCYKPHLYKRDLYTGVLPSQQFGDVSVANAFSVERYLQVNGIDGNPVTAGSYAFNNPDESLTSANTVIGFNSDNIQRRGSQPFVLSPEPAISVLELRRADALQRFKERMMRAGDKVKDIFKAHGWSEPLSEKSYEPIFLGSFDGRLDINTVASTTQNDAADLGQLAANGVCVFNGHKIKFKSNDFGVLMVVFYIQKDAVYNAFGLDFQHALTEPFDFPYPELQNISLAPVDVKAYSLYKIGKDLDARPDILGYLPAFMQFKTSVDTIHGEFYSGVSAFGDHEVQDGVFSDWVAPQIADVSLSDLYWMYIHPSCADTIFKVLADDTPATDQFLINVRFDCYCVEPLSVIGLPI